MSVTSTSLQRYLETLHKRFSSLSDGEVANYIPELGKADPDWFGIAIVTVDGHVYQVGDSRQVFTIQSISKAFTYGIALEDKGAAYVSSKVDVEPSGEAFNSISLESETGRPRNPMINAGAITATSLVEGGGSEARFQRILEKFSNFTGRDLEYDADVYASEQSTGHRNRAIAHLLRNYEILDGDPELPLDAYFRQCSILVNARDLALMGAALANDGVNPITGVRALESSEVPRVLSVMATCGMYDYSGNWIHNVGMPAKSGVGGGILAVLPGQLGVAVFSPRLDSKGNSVRGIAVCEALSREFGLHMLRVTRTTSRSTIRAAYSGAKVHSKLKRDLASTRYLDENGDQILVVELTGELMFVSAEIVSAHIIEKMSSRHFLILDFSRVSSIDRPATAILSELVERLSQEEKNLLFTGTDCHYHFTRELEKVVGKSQANALFQYADVDHALECAEDIILSDLGDGNQRSGVHPLKDQSICEGLDSSELDFLGALVEEEWFDENELVCQEDKMADKMYFLVSGRVSVSIKLDHLRRRRLATYTAGSAFGESALFGRSVRTADVIADTPVQVVSFKPDRLRNSKEACAASILTKMLGNLALHSVDRVDRTNEEIRVLTR